MPELKEVFAMVSNKVEPDMNSWHEQDQRQRRTARNRRIGVFVLAAAICGVAVVAILRTGDEAGRTEVGTDTTSSPTQVATSFAETYGAFDADGAIDYLADDADISGLLLGPTDVEGVEPELRLNLAMLDAAGFIQLLGSCEVTKTEGSASTVQCPFDFHIAGSDYGGQGSAPFTGASYAFSVTDGEISAAAVDWGGDPARIWKDFADWATQSHPDDAVSMFTDDSHSAIRLSEESLRLWRQRLYSFEEARCLGPFCGSGPG
jgi:hypothetical protein